MSWSVDRNYHSLYFCPYGADNDPVDVLQEEIKRYETIRDQRGDPDEVEVLNENIEHLTAMLQRWKSK